MSNPNSMSAPVWKQALYAFPSVIAGWIAVGAIAAMLLGIIDRFGGGDFAHILQIPVGILVLFSGLLFGARRGRVNADKKHRESTKD
jgi:type IV secretory pathway VirB2 component (pilin)